MFLFHLDGENDWLDIKGLDGDCISKIECVSGLSVGFWMEFSKGDYILAAGGYIGTTNFLSK